MNCAPFPRIGHVLNGRDFGGNESLCLQVIGAGVGAEHVLLDVGPLGGNVQPGFSNCGAEVVRLPFRRGSRALTTARLALRLRSLRLDGLIVYNFGLHLPIAFAARAARIPRVVVHAGNPPPLDSQARRKWSLLLVASRVLQVPILSCSFAVHDEFARLGHLPSGSAPLPNGIDVNRIDHLVQRAQAERRDATPTIAMVARFNSIKDHETLLKSMRLVRQEVPDAQLLLIGDGEQRDAIEGWIQEHNLSDAVQLLGARGDIPAILARVDVFAFSTTEDEGFGIALLEAMAARRAVVASDVRACREVLADTGVLVPARDPQAMGAALVRLLRDPMEVSRLGKLANQRALEQYDVRSCARRYYSLVVPGVEVVRAL